MQISQIFHIYSYVSLVFSISFLLILILCSPLSHQKISKNFLNRFSKILLLIAFFPSAFIFYTPERNFIIVKKSSVGQTLPDLKSNTETSEIQPSASKKIHITRQHKSFLWLLFLIGVLFFVVKYYLSILKIRKTLARGFVFKKIGRLQILISDELTIPIAVHLGKCAYILIPSSLVTNAKHFRLAVLHELQHHRQKDTLWVHWIYLIRTLFFWNPIIYWGASRIHEIQELACDENLIGRKDVSIREYCHCLVTVAKSASSCKNMLHGTSGMLEKTSAEKLKERINSMNQYHQSSLLSKLSLSCLSILIISSLSYGASAFFQEQAISLAEANAMLDSLELDGTFPVEVNDEILKELNYYLSNQDGKEFIEESLDRKAHYDHIFNEKVKEHKVPRELLAAALAESGFQNLPQERNPVLSAGIWQIIPSTGRNLGLRVDKQVDERLDVDKATDAAFRYLKALQLRFKDWRLAILAYNAGENKVQEGIDKTGSRDAWVLIKNGYTGDRGYLSKVMACVLILKNRGL